MNASAWGEMWRVLEIHHQRCPRSAKVLRSRQLVGVPMAAMGRAQLYDAVGRAPVVVWDAMPDGGQAAIYR